MTAASPSTGQSQLGLHRCCRRSSALGRCAPFGLLLISFGLVIGALVGLPQVRAT